MDNEMINNVNELIKLNGGESVTNWEDAYYAASQIARSSIRGALIVHVEMCRKGINVPVVVDKVMRDSSSLDGVVSAIMNLIFEGVNIIDLFANIRLAVSGWFDKYWQVEFNWAYGLN